MPQHFVYGCDRWEIDLARRELRAEGFSVPLGSRAFDIIEVLVGLAGQVVTKSDLMDRIWPNSIVAENTLYVHISAIRKALGRDNKLLKTASGRGYRLLGDWTLREESAATTLIDPAATTLAPEPFLAGSPGPLMNNLRVAGTELIGRGSVVQHLLDLLSAYRVVTLAGPGGIGKTRLSLEVARRLLPSFQGDGWLVDLVSLNEQGLVPSAVANSLGLDLQGDEVSSTSIARAIGNRKLLLVLDNCEHVIDAAANLAETILRTCARVSILATSQESLRIDGEFAYRVPALEAPPEDQQNADGILAHSAVQLFIMRMGELPTDLLARKSDLVAIGAICRRLDGMPLAIEFAAARAASLGAQQVLARLDDRFGLLTGGRRTALPRHQTLRATLDWSYELLPQQEQRLLRSLAIFPAGFTLEAAVGVIGSADALAPAIEEGIAHLVEKSLIDIDKSDSLVRWRLLETTKAYALDKLAEAGEAEHAARRQAEYFRGLFPAAESPMLKSADGGMKGLMREIGNVRAALDWAFSPGGDRAIGIHLTAAYVPVWLTWSLIEECRERTEQAVEALEQASDLSSHLRMQLYIALGSALMQVMAVAVTAEKLLTEALKIAESENDMDSQLQALWGLWGCAYYRGEYAAGKPFVERFSVVARRKGDLADMLVGDRCTGITIHYEGNQIEARACLERVLHLYAAPDDQRHARWFHHDQRAVTRAFLARAQWLQGHVDQAAANADTALQEAQAAHHDLSARYVLGWAVCPIAILTGNFAAAEASLKMFTDLVARHHPPYWKALGAALEGMLLIKRGELLGGTARLRVTLDTRFGESGLMRSPYFLNALAEGLTGLGQVAEALVIVEEAFERSDRTGELWCVPDQLRIKGELLARGTESHTISAAEDCFTRATAMAREQGALSWELKAAVSLAKVRLRQDRQDEARSVLASVYDRFTEGFESADLREARRLLALIESQTSLQD